MSGASSIAAHRPKGKLRSRPLFEQDGSNIQILLLPHPLANKPSPDDEYETASFEPEPYEPVLTSTRDAPLLVEKELSTAFPHPAGDLSSTSAEARIDPANRKAIIRAMALMPNSSWGIFKLHEINKLVSSSTILSGLQGKGDLIPCLVQQPIVISGVEIGSFVASVHSPGFRVPDHIAYLFSWRYRDSLRS